MSETDTGKAVQVLDLLLEFFGESGAHWTRGRYHDGHGRRCLIGALDYLRRKHRVPSKGAEYFLQEAMPHRRFALVYFNDHRCRSFAELRSIIVNARALALRDAERERAAAAVGRWLPAEGGKDPRGAPAAARKQEAGILMPRPPG